MKKQITTIADVEKRRKKNQDAIRKALAETADKEYQRRLEAATEAAQGLVEDYRDNHPAPDPNALQAHTAGLATDSRLGALRRNPQKIPMQALPMPQDLGPKPADPSYTGSAPHRATYRGTRSDARGGSDAYGTGTEVPYCRRASRDGGRGTNRTGPISSRTA